VRQRGGFRRLCERGSRRLAGFLYLYKGPASLPLLPLIFVKKTRRQIPDKSTYFIDFMRIVAI
jgi:hypothetical protein